MLIPVFALGRAQELCILLETYWGRAAAPSVEARITMTIALQKKVVITRYYSVIFRNPIDGCNNYDCSLAQECHLSQIGGGNFSKKSCPHTNISENESPEDPWVLLRQTSLYNHHSEFLYYSPINLTVCRRGAPSPNGCESTFRRDGCRRESGSAVKAA